MSLLVSQLRAEIGTSASNPPPALHNHSIAAAVENLRGWAQEEDHLE